MRCAIRYIHNLTILFVDIKQCVKFRKSLLLFVKFGNIQRIDNALATIPKLKEECEQKLTETKKQFEIAKVESKNEFPREAEYISTEFYRI